MGVALADCMAQLGPNGLAPAASVQAQHGSDPARHRQRLKAIFYWSDHSLQTQFKAFCPPPFRLAKLGLQCVSLTCFKAWLEPPCGLDEDRAAQELSLPFSSRPHFNPLSQVFPQAP